MNSFFVPSSYEKKSFTEIINPSTLFEHDENFLQTSFQGRTGKFSNIYKTWLSGGLFLPSKSKNVTSLLSLQLLNEKYNGFINQTRGYLGYTLKRTLSYKSSLSVGLNLGSYTYFLKGTKIVAGASPTTLDGNIGLTYQINKTYIGGSIAQFPNSEFIITTTINQLKRFYQFYLLQKIRFNLDWELTLSLQYFHKHLITKHQTSASLSYKDILFLESNYIDNIGLSTGVGITGQVTEKRKLHLAFYHMSIAEKSIRSRSTRYQFLLRYIFSK